MEEKKKKIEKYVIGQVANSYKPCIVNTKTEKALDDLEVLRQILKKVESIESHIKKAL